MDFGLFIFLHSTSWEFAQIFGADSPQKHSLNIFCRKDLLVHIVLLFFDLISLACTGIRLSP